MINLIFVKIMTSSLAFFALLKNKSSKAVTLITHLQDMSSITGSFEELCLKFPEHYFRRTHFSGCFLKLYYSYHVVFQWYFKTSKYIWICFCFFYLDTKSVVKINYGVPTHSATKLKKHKVQNWVNTDIFKHNFR